MRRLLSLALLSAATAPALAQAITTLKTTARLVTVDVAVTDSKGAPITGLTCADFRLLDKKVPQNLRTCEDHTDAPPVPAPPPQNLPPNVFTNTNAVPLPPTLDVLVFDFLNTGAGFAGTSKMRDLLRTALTKPIPGHRVAIFALSGNLQLLSGFSDDGITNDALVQSKVMAASAFIGGPSPQGIPGGRSQLARQMASLQQQVNSKSTVQQMQAVAAFLAPLPGRKRVIWIAGNSPFALDRGMNMSDEGVQSEDYRSLSNALVENRIQIFPVDVNGVHNFSGQRDPWTSGSRSVPSRSFESNTSFFALSAFSPDVSYRFALDTIAADTGGKAFYGSNGVDNLLKKALNYGNLFYTLTYTPTQFKPDGSFHPLKISVVNRKAHLNHRGGYLAPDEKLELVLAKERAARIEATGKSVLPERTQAEREVAEAMMRGLPSTTSVLFSVRIVPPPNLDEPHPLKTRTQEEGDLYGIDFSVNAADITWTPQHDLQTALVRMRVAVYDASSNSIENKETATALRLTPEQFAKARTQGLQLHFDVPLQLRSGSHLRLGMEDTATHHIGTVEIDNGSLVALATVPQLPGNPPPAQP